MLIRIQPIRWISGIVFGLIITPISVEAATLQRAFQEAFVKGTQNKVEQEVSQNLSSFFEIKAELNTDSSISFKLKEFSQSENQEAIFLDQLSGQETVISGAKNKVTQAINQTQVNIFSVSADFLIKEVSLIEPLFSMSDRFLEADQFGFQDAVILGDNNQVSQKINQTLISLFFIEDDVSSVLGDASLEKPLIDLFKDPFQDRFLPGKRNRVEQNIYQNSIEAFFTKPDIDMDFLINLDSEKLTDLEAIEWLAQEENLSLYKIKSYSSHLSFFQLSQPIPEPNSTSGILALGIGGVSLILAGKRKS